MKYREIKKLIGVVATASVLSACGTTLDQDNVVQNDTSEVVSNEASTEQSEVKDVVTKAKVTYEQSATGADELSITNDEPQDYLVKEYERPIFFKYLTELDYDYTYDADTNTLNHDNAIVSDDIELVEDDAADNDGVVSAEESKPIIYARDFVIGEAIPVVKYLKVSDTEVEAKYISLAPSDSNLVSGITFEFRYDYDAENYKMTGILGVFGEDLSTLETYEGEFDFYSATVDGDEYCKPNDTITISQDTTLFPNFAERENALLANEDGTYVGGNLEIIENMAVLRVIHVYKYKEDKDGNQTTVAAYALDGLNTDADTVKNTDGSTIDNEKVKEQQKDDVKEAEEKKKAEEEQKKKEEETKKKQEESKKKEQQSGGGSGNSGSGSSSQKPSGNSGQSGNNVSNETPTNDTSAGAAAWGVTDLGNPGLDGVCDSATHISGE